MLSKTQPQARRGAFAHDLATEAEKSGGPATGARRRPAGRLDQCGGLDQAAEVLLVQVPAGDRFDGPLQFGQGELLRHQLEYDRTVLELAAQAADGGHQDASVIESHRPAEWDEPLAGDRVRPPVAGGLLDETGRIEQLVALECALLVPGNVALAEGKREAIAAREPGRIAGRLALGSKGAQRWKDDLVEHLRSSGTPVLPGAESVP